MIDVALVCMIFGMGFERGQLKLHCRLVASLV